jgi:hypothetical protein
MNQTQENLKDAELIREKIVFYASKTPRDLLDDNTIDRKEIQYTISDLSGRKFICGHEGSLKFHDLANRYLKSFPDKKQKFNIRSFVKNLHRIFLRRFINGDEEITNQNISRMLSETLRQSEREFRALTHYVPCNILHSSKNVEFKIGAIKFLHETRFDDIYLSEIENLRTTIAEDHQIQSQQFSEETGSLFGVSCSPEQSRELADRAVDSVISLSKPYEWVAEVKIDKCAPEISYERAVLSIKTALNILKLMLGGEYTNRIRIGDDDSQPLESAKLTREETGNLTISLSRISRGKPIGDKWIDFLQEDCIEYLNVLNPAIELLISFEKISPLWERFLDALSWYGDAVTESSEAAKIIKFVSAIERITGTGKENNSGRGVTDITISRASILHSRISNEKLSDSIQRVEHIYDQRSNLVHGSLSPLDEACTIDAIEAEDITRFILLAGLNFFDSLGLADKSLGQRKLKSCYEDLERQTFDMLHEDLQKEITKSVYCFPCGSLYYLSSHFKKLSTVRTEEILLILNKHLDSIPS